jgi:Domain of unknown function (DUF4349)
MDHCASSHVRAVAELRQEAPALMADGTSDSVAADDEPLAVPDVTNMVVRTATASIEVDSLEPAITQLKALAARVGGYVGASGIEGGKNRLRTAFIEVKIPASHFDDALSGLTPIGKLESVNVQKVGTAPDRPAGEPHRQAQGRARC